MATLIPADGSPTTPAGPDGSSFTPDHPLLIALSGSASFADASLRLLNKLVYKWDPDSTRIVLRPGTAGVLGREGRVQSRHHRAGR